MWVSENRRDQYSLQLGYWHKASHQSLHGQYPWHTFQVLAQFGTAKYSFAAWQTHGYRTGIQSSPGLSWWEWLTPAFSVNSEAWRVISRSEFLVVCEMQVVRSEGEERDLHKKQRCKTIRTASKSSPGCFLTPWNRWTIMYILNMAWVVTWIGWKSTELRHQLMPTRWEASPSPYKGYM